VFGSGPEGRIADAIASMLHHVDKAAIDFGVLGNDLITVEYGIDQR
jgi:hypothetical protein